MVARARGRDESYEDYRINLKKEAFNQKIRLKLGPTGWKHFQKYLRVIDIDEDKDDRTVKYKQHPRDTGNNPRRLQVAVRDNPQVKGHNRVGGDRNT